jgi:hypothetical protein
MSRCHQSTSAAAYASIEDASAHLERVVLKVLDQYPDGLTVDETCALKDRGAIRDTGLRRQNESGRNAIVWRACHHDRREAQA